MNRFGRIYLDFDDVICETASRLSELLYELHGRRVAYEEIHAFDLGVSFALARHELNLLMRKAHEDDWLMALKPTDGAIDGIQHLSSLGYEPVVVTGRPAHCYRVSQAWLSRYGLSGMEVIYVDKYGRDPGTCDPSAPVPLTADALLELPFTLAVDDSPMALDVLKGRVAYPVMVFDRPWNRQYATGPGMVRAMNWSDICRSAERLIQAQ